MRNPWLDIPLAEYEGHMALPAVRQAEMLADELEFAVRQHAPKSIAVVGCAGGNGLDRLIGTGVERIVGIDINPAYVSEVAVASTRKFPGSSFMSPTFSVDYWNSHLWICFSRR